MTEDTRHQFSLGPEHNVCARCGFDLHAEPQGPVTPCPHVLAVPLDDILRAARERGYNDACHDIFAMIETVYRAAKEAKDIPLAHVLRELSKNLPRKRSPASIPGISGLLP